MASQIDDQKYHKTITKNTISVTNLKILMNKLNKKQANLKTKKDRLIYDYILQTPAASTNFYFSQTAYFGYVTKRMYVELDRYGHHQTTLLIRDVIKFADYDSAVIGLDDRIVEFMTFLNDEPIVCLSKPYRLMERLRGINEYIVTETFYEPYDYSQPDPNGYYCNLRWFTPEYVVSVCELQKFHDTYLLRGDDLKDYEEIFNYRSNVANFYVSEQYNIVDELCGDAYHIMSNKLMYYVGIKSNVDLVQCKIGVSKEIYDRIKG